MKKLLLGCLIFLGATSGMNAQSTQPRTLFPIDNNSGFIDRQGRVVIKPQAPELVAEIKQLSLALNALGAREDVGASIRFEEFSEGRAVAGWALCPQCRNPLWVSAIINEAGRPVIPPINSSTRYGRFHEGLAQYFDQGWGFIDPEGRVVIPAKYYEAADFSEGLAAVRLSEARQYGYLNPQGKLVIPFGFEVANTFSEGLAAVRIKQGKMSYIDKTGKAVLSNPAWLSIGDFSEKLAAVQIEVTDNSVYQGYKELKYGFIDRSGQFVIQPRYSSVQPFAGGRALFFQTGKAHGYGYIDVIGQIVIQPAYADAKSFSEGLAAVAVLGLDEKKRWGYVNRDGTLVMEPQFQFVNSFRGGLAAVNCDEYGRNCKTYIDPQGVVVWHKP